MVLRELGYPSNILTLARLVLLPLILITLRKPEQRRRAFWFFVLAILTDAIDGPVARWRQEVSAFGKVFDPIADKVLLDSIAVMLAKTTSFPWWVTVLLLSRDVGILLAGLYVYQRKKFLTPSQITGKATTVSLTAAILLYLAEYPHIGKPVLSATLVLATASVVQYGYRFVLLLRPGNHQPGEPG